MQRMNQRISFTLSKSNTLGNLSVFSFSFFFCGVGSDRVARPQAVPRHAVRDVRVAQRGQLLVFPQLPPLRVPEAVVSLFSFGYDVLAFRRRKSGCLKIVYTYVEVLNMFVVDIYMPQTYA